MNNNADNTIQNGPLAQLVEHLTLNQGVQGSSPWRALRSTVFGSLYFRGWCFFVVAFLLKYLYHEDMVMSGGGGKRQCIWTGLRSRTGNRRLISFTVSSGRVMTAIIRFGYYPKGSFAG